MRLLLSALGALGALHVLGVQAQAAPSPECITTCSSNTRGQFTTYGCTNADDAGCLCANADFSYSVRDCAIAACGATESDVQTYMSQNFCNGLMAAPSSSAAATSAAATTTATEPASSAAAATSEVSSASQAATTEAATTSTSAVAATSESAQKTTTAVPSSATASTALAESTATESATSTTTTSSGTSGAAGAGASSTSAADKDENEEDEHEESHGKGLSSAAEIGIGVGIGAVVLAIIGAVLCVMLKSRRRKQELRRRGPSVEISQPLPGGGRAYAAGDNSSVREKNNYDIELMSNRYEDMVPRATPRNMV